MLDDDVRDRPLVIRNDHDRVRVLALMVEVFMACAIGWIAIRQERQGAVIRGNQADIQRKLDDLTSAVEAIRLRVVGDGGR